ncbi:type I restriction endonuclease subunit S [Vibrio anguillarum]|uniref:restriction endonuclease subunit S n=1 Tax=Vibrio anguillarum TaxID=55601 RepID=UPI000B53B267|nr:restriction endonuclease subunit S [Vibrio anguillarum]ASG07657.1 type I restriction endonuclease subunit S [Vibrio anguillarum]
MTDKKTVKFGDICKEVKLTTKDPIGDGYERYIGLEHLDSGSLKIKRWGMIAEDSPSFTRVFKKGQILFGKRRPYLKKAAIAEFDGICSGDIIVLDPHFNKNWGPFIPFLIHSERFWAWAIKHSSGSLSPRTKYSEISRFELPCFTSESLDKLTRVCEKLEELYFLCESSFESTLTLSRIVISELVKSKDSYDELSLSELVKRDKSISYGIVQTGKGHDDVRCLRVVDIVNGNPKYDELIGTSNEISDSYSKTVVTEGDITFALRGEIGAVYRVTKEFEGCNLTRGLALISVKDELCSSRYIYWMLQSEYVKRQLAERTNGSALKEIPLKELRKIKVPMLKNRTEQEILANCLDDLWKYSTSLDKKKIQAKSIFDSLVRV